MRCLKLTTDCLASFFCFLVPVRDLSCLSTSATLSSMASICESDISPSEADEAASASLSSLWDLSRLPSLWSSCSGESHSPSFLDGLGNGLGYGAVLMAVAFFREILGSGSLWGFKIFEGMGLAYQGNGVMLIPAGACLVLGILIWAQRARNGYFETE